MCDVSARARLPRPPREWDLAGLPDVSLRPHAPGDGDVELIGGPLLIASFVAVLFGVFEQVSLPAAIATIPEFLWELSLGLPRRQRIRAVPDHRGVCP